MNLNLNEFKCLLPINYVEMSQIEAINGKVSQTKQSKLCFALLWHVTEIISETPHRHNSMGLSKINTVKNQQVSHITYPAHFFFSLKKILMKCTAVMIKFGGHLLSSNCELQHFFYLQTYIPIFFH